MTNPNPTDPGKLESIDADELARLRAVDAKHGWKERPPSPPILHDFSPHPKWPWFCGQCGYAPYEPLQHNQ